MMVNNSAEHSLATFLSKYDKIVIPDIQRDYVMGSGGGKLTELLQSICDVKYQDITHPKKGFKFSAIMGYVDPVTNTFYVYDGQQRLATLIYLCASYDEAQIEENLLSKFEFMDRYEANLYLKNLIHNKEDIPNIVDFTTFSLNILLSQFRECRQTDKHGYSSFEKIIGFEYLYKNIVFNVVPVKEVSDAEQFFMDLNDGLVLEEYEIFKSELFHQVRTLSEEKFKKFALRMDNKWLRFFSTYITEIVERKEKKMEKRILCEEEIEVAFVQFCLRMMWIEERETEEGYIESNVDWIEMKHIERLEKIIDHMVELDLSGSKMNCINYSFGDRIDRFWNRDVNNVEGVFWNLADSNYGVMLIKFLSDFCKPEYEESVKKDIVIWAYISNCEKSPEVLFPHLRFIKKVLNHNRIINNNAYYDGSGTMWYTKYSAYGIPLYYTEYTINGKLNKSFHNDIKKNSEYIFSVSKLVAYKVDKLNIGDFDTENAKLNEILKLEFQKESLGDKQTEVLENLSYVNGNINDNFFENFGSEIYFNNRKSLFELYYNFGKMIPKDIMYPVNVKWRTYYDYNQNVQRYSNKDFCNILPLTITDLLIDYKQLDNPEEDNSWLEYVKYYNCYSDGWRSDYYDYCLPRKDNESGNFVSVNSRKYPGNPILNSNVADILGEASVYTVRLDGENNIIEIQLNNKLVPKGDSPWIIQWNIEWFKKLLTEKNYTLIKYTDNLLYSKKVLTSYCRKDMYNGMNFINECIEKQIDCVVPALNSRWFITYQQLLQFKNLCLN